MSSAAAEDWCTEFLVRVFDKLDLPEKYHLIGLCYSGHPMALYASRHPERVLSYFGITPCGFASVEDYPLTYQFKSPPEYLQG